MGQATEKQKWSLKNRFGYPDDMIANIDFNAASNIIKNQISYEKVGGQQTITPKPLPKQYQMQDGDKKTTMYVSYSKDLFIAIVNDCTTKEPKAQMNYDAIMDKCISLVKQAKGAFE